MPGPQTQNQYSPTAVPLDGGLDLINPKITIQAGSVSSCLNVERTDRVGYSRSMGMERFDGGMAPSLAYTNLVYILHSTIIVFPPARDEAFRLLDDTITNGPVLGCCVLATATKTLLAITNFDEWRVIQQKVAAGGHPTITFKGGGSLVVGTIVSFNDNAPTSNAQALTDFRNQDFKSMRAEVTAPGEITKPVIGLHGFKDQLYAVKDLNTVAFSSGASEVFPNDVLHKHGAVTPDDDVRVLDVHLVSGAWGSTAAGYFLIDGPHPASGVYDINRVITPVSNAVTLGSGSTDAWFAGMYRSSSFDQSVDLSLPEGWSPVEMGFTMGFVDGQSNGPFRVARRGTFSDFDTDVITGQDTGTVGSTSDSTFSMTPVAGDTWDLIGAGTVPLCLESTDLTAYIRRTINNTDPNAGYVPGNIYISNFAAFSGFSTASSLTVEGIEVTVIARPIRLDDTIRTFSVAVQPVTTDTTLQAGSAPQQQNLLVDFASPPAQQTVQTLVFGGPTDLFGMDAATAKAGMDSGWGMAVQPWVQIVGGVRAGIIDIIHVDIKVYYKATVSAYYFWDGSSDVTADITNFFVSDGDWSTNDAEGTLQVTNIEAVGSGNRLYITDGDEIRTDPNGGGLLVATVDGDMTFNGLETLLEIEEVNSRYQFITENFFADKDFEGMYGVSGAGRAFSWDGFYFTRVFTQADATKDIPRHITNHQFHLVLGYEAGANLLSVAGNPFDFNGVNGAVEIDTGDPVVGYARMSGTTLGIFCKKTIQGLIGTSIDNFSLSILSPYEGAIEYTVCDIGKPVYCSYRGISLFDQTAAYGDFAGQRMSYVVTPFLIPRLQGLTAPLDNVAASNGPAMALPCRTKNQYRLFFEDGYCLTMTLAGSEQQPMFTIQAPQLMNDTGETFYGYFVPRAESSFVDSTGVERIHMGPYSKSVLVPNYYVYEFERSWSFDGAGIPAYFVTNENFYGSIFDIDNPRKTRLHGLSYGWAPITVRLGADYDPNDTLLYVPREVLDISLPRGADSVLSSDFRPFTNITNPAKRGRSFSMRFMSYNQTAQQAGVKDPVFATVTAPWVIQAMLPQYTENKGDV